MAWRAFLAVGSAAAVIHVLADPAGLVEAQMITTVSGVAVAAVGLAVRRRRLEPVGVWRLLVVSAFLYWLGLAWATWLPQLTERSVGFPAVRDVLSLAAYTGLALFLAVVVRRHSDEGGGEVLDVLVVAAGVAAVVYELGFRPLSGVDLPGSVRLAAAAYTALLGLVLVAGLRVAAIPARPRAIHVLVVGWLAVTLTLEIRAVATAIQGGDAVAGRSVGWVIAYVLLAAAAVHPELGLLTAPATTDRVLGRRVRMAVLAAAGVAPLVAMTIAEDVLGYERPNRVVARLVVMLIIVAIVTRLGRSVGELAEEQRLREGLEHAAVHDQLTGLANRAGFDQALRRALVGRHATDRHAVVLMADLDGFKAVNDTYGHEAGDELLREVSRRFVAQVRPSDVVGRLGGDEFAVVIDDIAVPEGLAIADRLADAVSRPIPIGPATPALGVSIGVYRAAPGDVPDEALRRADTAMYAAKTAGGGVELFDAERHRRFLDRYRLELELRAAADAGQLVLHYQPIVRLDDRSIVAVEALLRWQHPERGWLLPGEFIELAEASGAIIGIGRWVLQEACREAAAWSRRFSTSRDWRGVTVNMSRRQLDSPTLVRDVAGALADSGLPPGELTLEITETALAEDAEQAIAVMRQLQELGVSLALDDFGTGYSSLADLQRMPLDVLKIDRAFVEGVARTDEEWALASAIVGLATSLGKRTLAEGIEEPAQLAHLRSLGCELGQGYLFGRPAPAAELESTHLPVAG